MKKERFEAITDAILAIIITIMALEIHLPDLSNEGIQEFVKQIGIYLVSYAFIGILWVNHHQMFKQVKEVDHTAIWLNFLMLFTTSMIPLATKTINESFYNTRSHILFAVAMGTTTLLYFLLDERAIKLSPDRRPGETRTMNLAGTCLFFLAIPLSFVSVWLSTAIFVMVPLSYFMLPRLMNIKHSN